MPFYGKFNRTLFHKALDSALALWFKLVSINKRTTEGGKDKEENRIFYRLEQGEDILTKEVMKP